MKPFSSCATCPRQCATETHPYHYINADVDAAYDVLIVMEAPVNDRHLKPPRGVAFDDVGKVVRETVKRIQASAPAFAALRVGYTYAVRCASNMGDKEPPKAALLACRPEMYKQIAAHGVAPGARPVLFLMGKTAVTTFGVKARKLADVSGRVLLDGASMPLPDGEEAVFDAVVSLSTKQLATIAGLYLTFQRDLMRAFGVAVERRRAPGGAAAGASYDTAPGTSLEALTKGYRVPMTVEDVKALCREVIDYTEGVVGAAKWPIAIDTETNTRFPHRDGLKILAVSVAWGHGKAACIPLDHPETPFDWREVVDDVKVLLASPKPKLLHNAKFDLKVFMKLGWHVENFAWDTMLAEHLLEEDKKGFYGLKPLTRAFFPEFASYADALHETLEKEEGATQLANLEKKTKKKKGKEGDVADAGEAATAAIDAQMAMFDMEALTSTAPTKAVTEPVEEDVVEESVVPAPGGALVSTESDGFEKIPLPTLSLYAAVDADMTRRLAMLQEGRLRDEEARGRAVYARQEADSFRKIELPPPPTTALPVRRLAIRDVFATTTPLARIELDGVRCNRDKLEVLKAKMTSAIDATEEALFLMAGNNDLKLNSPADIARVLFEEGFTHPESGRRIWYSPDDIPRTATGKISTTARVMQQLVSRYKCPFATKKLLYAKATKIRDTFLANVEALSALDGRIHTSYNQHGTSTGRLSSNDVNMQNIPKKLKGKDDSVLAGVNVKELFIPTEDDMVFVNADGKGAEITILAAYARDPALIQALKEGRDTHSFFSAEITKLIRLQGDSASIMAGLGLPEEYAYTYEDFAGRDEVRKKQPKYADVLSIFRDYVKRAVFGTLYGAGPGKIAELLGIEKEQAVIIIDSFFGMFPTVKAYVERTQWELRTFNYVETFFGRRRRFNVPGAPKYAFSKAERQTVNFKIQSTSSEVVMDRLRACEGPLRDMGGRILLTVHDSLGFEVRKKYVSHLPDFVEEVLKKGATKKFSWLPVDFAWDYEVGPSYGELMPYHQYVSKFPYVPERDEAGLAYTDEDFEEALLEAMG